MTAPGEREAATRSPPPASPIPSGGFPRDRVRAKLARVRAAHPCPVAPAMPTTVEITSLEMLDPSALVRSARPDGATLSRAEIPCPELNRFLYTAVGGDFHWIDRLGWTYVDWMAYLDRPELETWLLAVRGTIAGYFELEEQDARSVQIKYFGLLPAFVGRGLGGWLLTAAVERAFARGARRVWLHTCTLDHPHAARNYEARGFVRFATETHVAELAPSPPGPWPGAGPRRSAAARE